MVNTRSDNANKHLGLVDKARTKRSSEEVAEEKRLKEEKKALNKAKKISKQAEIKKAEAQLKQQQAQSKVGAVKGPSTTQTKVKRPVADLVANSQVSTQTQDVMAVDGIEIVGRESSVPLIPPPISLQKKQPPKGGIEFASSDIEMGGNVEDSDSEEEKARVRKRKASNFAAPGSNKETVKKPKKAIEKKAPIAKKAPKPKPSKLGGLVDNWKPFPSSPFPSSSPPPSPPPTFTKPISRKASQASVISISSQVSSAIELPADVDTSGTDDNMVRYGGFISDKDQDSDDSFSLKEMVVEATVRRPSNNKLVKIEPGHQPGQAAPTGPATPAATPATVSGGSSKRSGIKDLPADCQFQFSSEFVPLLLAAVGASKRPWEVPGERTLVKLWRKVFTHRPFNPTLVGRPARQQVYNWRSNHGEAAVLAVKKLFANKEFAQRERYNARTGYSEPDPLDKSREQKVSDYINTALGEPSLPFIWKDYKVGPSGAVVKHAAYQSEIVLSTFAVHFGTKGINSGAESLRYGKDAAGAMALALTAVHRALLMFRSGIFVQPEDTRRKKFSQEQWGKTTDRYLEDTLAISDTRWAAILKAVRPFISDLNAVSRRGRKKAADQEDDTAVHASVPDSDPY